MSQLLGCNNQILVVECTVQRRLRTGWYIGLISFSGRSRWREAEIEMTLRVSLCQVRSSVWSVGVSIRRQREIIGGDGAAEHYSSVFPTMEVCFNVFHCVSLCLPLWKCGLEVDCHQSHQIHIWTRGGSELLPAMAKKPSLGNTRCAQLKTRQRHLKERQTRHPKQRHLGNDKKIQNTRPAKKGLAEYSLHMTLINITFITHTHIHV